MAFSDADFSESDRAQLVKLEQDLITELDANAGNTPGGQPNGEEGETHEGETTQTTTVEKTETTQTATATTAATETATTPSTETPQPAAEQPGAKKGDQRVALRAARHGERIQRRRADQLEAQLRELQQQAPPKSDETDVAAVLSVLEADHPEVAAVVKPLVEKVNDLQTKLDTAQTKRAETPAFAPEVLPDDLQDVIDSTEGLEQLETWRVSADMQEHWQAAKAADRLLLNLPRWKQASEAERLAEVIRRVNADMAAAQVPATKQPDPKEQARARIEAAPKAGIETLSDLRGGETSSTTTTPDYTRMSDEEIIASL